MKPGIPLIGCVRTRKEGHPVSWKWMSSPQALILFDIDGTLLRKAGPHHRQALIEAVRRTTGIETSLDGIPVAGMLDRDILAEIEPGGVILFRRNVGESSVEQIAELVAELQRLPNVGPVLAQRIILARSERPFRSLEDLRRVPGIGPKTLEKLRPFVTFD